MHRFMALVFALFIVFGAMNLAPSRAAAAPVQHRNGCHAWHSCPSDSGSYVCGDTGHGCNFDAAGNRISQPPSKTKAKPAPAAPATQAVVAVASLNLRAGASTSNRILGTYPRGTVFTYLGQANGWYHVSRGGLSGWMLASSMTLR